MDKFTVVCLSKERRTAVKPFPRLKWHVKVVESDNIVDAIAVAMEELLSVPDVNVVAKVMSRDADGHITTMASDTNMNWYEYLEMDEQFLDIMKKMESEGLTNDELFQIDSIRR